MPCPTTSSTNQDARSGATGRHSTLASRRLPLTTGTNAGLFATHCDRIDPPWVRRSSTACTTSRSYTYRPPIKADGTSYPQADHRTAVPCDPFTSGCKDNCRDWYTYDPQRLLRQRQRERQRRRRQPDLQQPQHQAVVRHRHHLRRPDPVAGDRLLQQRERRRHQPGPVPPQRLGQRQARERSQAPHRQPVPLQQRHAGDAATAIRTAADAELPPTAAAIPGSAAVHEFCRQSGQHDDHGRPGIPAERGRARRSGSFRAPAPAPAPPAGLHCDAGTCTTAGSTWLRLTARQADYSTRSPYGNGKTGQQAST